MATESPVVDAAGQEGKVVYGPRVLGTEILVSGEEVTVESRPVAWLHLLEPAFAVVVGLVIMGLAGYLEQRYPEFEYWYAVRWTGIGVALIAAVSLLSAWLRWRYTIYALTNKRILRRTGVFGRSYLDCSLGKVQNVEVTMTPLGRILNFGTIRIATARTKGQDIEWTDVRGPILMQRLINEALERHNKDSGQRE